MGHDINGLHHVGHIVQDMDQAMERYRRLGFTVTAPAYPVMPTTPGGPVEPFGVANAHVHFPRGFVELVAVIGDTGRMPGDARPIPLQVPEDKVPGLRAAIRATAANITSFLQRFQGVHIMIADTPDIDRVAARLTADGVSHGGVHDIQRPVETATGTRMEPARYLEVSDPDLPPGRVPEGRIGFAENTPAEAPQDRRHTDHPNGSTGLVECVLCVADTALPELERRYGSYFGRARHGRVTRFDRANVTVVAASALADLLPGERPAVLPAFVAYAVAVRDLSATEKLLRSNGIPVTRTGPEEMSVPTSAALGVAIIFRQDG
ncbi:MULTISPECIES: VOC family protein [Streptosporangium]|uniref:Catechol 2,3-dioxygenase-like lactoylglutathione lyase family enzyme n=1 Tax=Streptosporangium brasiliense TaxID=47480 RepID=A0ABT9RH26_9ACTN|nr:VOC family protein [Streptosporangium brasiliense]MDP9868591.1 catechol 2,3-dioxygenase-like lactoylglutathione lyase family enzyme [Streptosporangium brasiliense]